MPTYEFSCNECGTFGSTFRSFTEDVPTMDCPKCHTLMTRLYSAPGIVFKGRGWGSKP
jgi:putative FmdB family regulatory protein